MDDTQDPHDPGTNVEDSPIVANPQAVRGGIDTRQTPNRVAPRPGIQGELPHLVRNAPEDIGGQGSQVFEGAGSEINDAFGHLRSAFLPRYSP